MKLQTSSTSPPNAWLEPHPRLEGLALIDHLFNRLDGLYPNKWRASFANDHAIANWRTAWAEAFADEGISIDEVRAGLKACRRRDWPPSFAEFFKDCRPSADHQSALIEAIEQMARRESGSDRWSHPAIYWAAVKIGSYDLSRKSLKELDKEWRKAYSDQLAIGQWGDIPERLPALPAPGQTHSREVGKETIQAMLARLKSAADAHCKASDDGA
ncbi:MAG: hypothetical protein QG584_285 [Pseudomonadota bacterium]|uniref:replication protein P n=1 Tax=Dokdonella sp. TaxID=2291710 RepID=UPI0027EDBB71|nr:replication protein P [Dokdonella sp.]MDQ5914403.1 hypothetical protein [Pseudomonadota bacterium]